MGSKSGELSSRQNCVRLFFIICNIPIVLFGLATLGIGIWQIVEEDRLEEVLSERYTVAGAIFVAAGAITLFVSLVGILGAAMKYKYALLMYLAILFLIVALEIVVFGYAIAKADDIDDDQIRMDLLNALDRYYPSNASMGEYDEDLNDVIDFIQETLECCGVNNSMDWIGTPYYEETDGDLPSSCCDGEPEECPIEESYNKGCQDALADYIQDNLYLLVGIAIAFAVFEVAMLVMSFYLFMAINNAYQGYERA